MNSKLWIRNAVTMCLLVALVATYSMVALASDGKNAGELVITGGSETSFVTVNGEVAKSGRTIFSSSTISTPEGAGAIVNLGKVGRIELSPDTTFALSFDDNSINGDLASGSITVLNAHQSVGVKNAAGEFVKLNVGETATADSGAASKAPTKSVHGHDWAWYALIFGGAAAVIIYTAAKRSDRNFGGTGTVISPVR